MTGGVSLSDVFFIHGILLMPTMMMIKKKTPARNSCHMSPRRIKLFARLALIWPETWTTNDDHHFYPLLSEVEYYLKLNSFGRRLLDSRNIRRSLWPAISLAGS
jgi:hypothetical protein